MNEEKTVPYVVFEGTQVRHERTAKRLIIALVIAILLIFASNAIWLYAWCQYDYTSTESTVEQQADNGIVSYVGNDGDINNDGLPESDNTNEDTP